jgi:hypothetical protein
VLSGVIAPRSAPRQRAFWTACLIALCIICTFQFSARASNSLVHASGTPTPHLRSLRRTDWLVTWQIPAGRFVGDAFLASRACFVFLVVCAFA